MTFLQDRPRWALTQPDIDAGAAPEPPTAAALVVSVTAVVDVGYRPPTTDAALQLDRLSRLTPGWDGASAPPIYRTVLQTAARLISSPIIEATRTKPQLVPTLDGGVQLEWHTEDLDLVIECTPGHAVTYWIGDAQSGDEVEGALVAGGERLDRAFTRLGYQG